MATTETREDWPLIERVRILNLGPNDQLVLEVPGDLTELGVKELGIAFAAAFPGHRYPVILCGGATLAGVIRGGDAPLPIPAPSRPRDPGSPENRRYRLVDGKPVKMTRAETELLRERA